MSPNAIQATGGNHLSASKGGCAGGGAGGAGNDGGNRGGAGGKDGAGGGEETATVQKSERTNVSLTSRADTKTFAPLVKCRQLPNSLVKSS